MNLIAVPSAEHNDSSHPENARRIPAVLEVLRADASLSSAIAHRAPFGPATDDQLATVHARDYIHALREAMAHAPGIIDYAPTYITPKSFDCAALAAGAALTAVETAASNPQSGISFALIRPPGHHAPPTHAMGFCLFNNIALAARHAQRLGFSRVMIYDFDVHHGNGTQDAFYADPSVLFISSHQSGIYPLSGHVEEIGERDGKGFTINVPLPSGAGDASFRRVAAEIVVPAADRFQPDLLLVSAGYDAHWRDPLASLQLSCGGFHMLGTLLAGIARRHCGSRLIFVLEGGYDPAALAHGVRNTIRGALGLPVDDPPGPAPQPEPDVNDLIDNVKRLNGLG